MLARWLEQQWYRWTPWHVLLLPLAVLFGILAAVRRSLYRLGFLRVCKLPVPVMIVGNIGIGGTGKTPLVIALARSLREQGFRPAIISRGYGSKSRLPRAVSPYNDPSDVGDEPILLATRAACPVWVGPDRVAVGEALLATHPEVNVLISDDGLQHYRLARDIEIVVVDAARWFGNGQLLPAGPLREPAWRLQTVDAVVINGWAPGAPLKRREYTMQLAGDLLYNLRNPELKARPEVFVGQTVHAVAGIGHPQRFFKHLQKLGLKVRPHPFPDHHAYVPQDLVFPESVAIVMTEKDAVKCVDFVGDNAWALPVQARLDVNFIPAMIELIRNADGPETA